MTAPVEFDPELAEALARMQAAGDGTPVLSLQTLAAARAAMALPDGGLAAAIGDRRIDYKERGVPGPPGAPDLTVLILRPRELTAPVPVIYSIHGGGMMVGNRYTELPRLVSMAEDLGIVVISPEYRLAPEHPYPAGVEDCFAGLCWAAEHVGDTILVMGGSAGGGLAAAVAMLARDRGGPALVGQALLCPMIDDRNDSPSTLQYADLGMWTRASNALGWSCLLGSQRRTVPDYAVPDYAAPARAAELGGLPPAYIEVGEAEIFRDEDVAYCAGLWRAGVSAELHVWARAYHGFDLYAPGSEVTAAALAARSSWLRRQFRRV